MDIKTRIALIASLHRWIDNARRGIRTAQEELSAPDPVNPATLAARQADLFAKIEAWEQVLRELGE